MGPLNPQPFVNVKERPAEGENLSARKPPQENVNWITNGIKSGRKVDFLRLPRKRLASLQI